MRGVIRLYEGTTWKRGRLLWECENLFVSTGLVALANLAGGASGYPVAAVGFGSGSVPVTVGDTDLSSAPKYYKTIDGVVIGPAGGVASGSVQFAYSLTTGDTGANPLTIQELGLFSNVTSLALPSTTAAPSPMWCHAVVPSFPYVGAGNYAGTWTISM